MIEAPVVPALLGAGIIEASGLGFTTLVPTLRRRALTARLGWAWLLGSAWVGGVSFMASHVFGLTLRRGLVLPLALMPMALALLMRRRLDVLPVTSSRSRGGWERTTVALLVGTGLLVSLGLLASGLAVPVSDWDGKMTWIPQARFIRAARTVDAPVLRDSTTWVIHPRYPALLPVLQVAVAEAVGASRDDRFARGLNAFFWPACLLVLFDATRERAGFWAAAIATIAAAAVPFLAFGADGGAASAYSDFPLACLWGGGLLLLTSKDAEVRGGLAAGLLLGGAILSKNEGVPLTVVALVAAILASIGKARERAHAVAAAATVCAASALLLGSWQSSIPVRYDDAQLTLASLRDVSWASLSRVPDVLRRGFLQTAEFESWGLVWVAVPLGMLLGVRRLRRAEALPLLLSVFAAALVYFTGYLVTRWSVHTIVLTTANRFVAHLTLPLFTLLGIALAPASPSSSARIE